jgi:hypothetical protein
MANMYLQNNNNKKVYRPKLNNDNKKVYRPKLNNNKKKVYRPKLNNNNTNNNYKTNIIKNQMNIPIYKLNKKSKIPYSNENIPSVNILLKYFWPEYYEKTNKPDTFATKIKKQIQFEEKNKNWIDFYNNN